MTNKKTNSRKLEFKLSAEASIRIKHRIKCGDITILQSFPDSESTLKKRGLIVNEATRILSLDGISGEGCSDENAVKIWLNRERGKELAVFRALCLSVDENWLEVFDRSPYEDILIGERKKSLDIFLTGLLDVFIPPSPDNMDAIVNHRDAIEQIINSDQIDSETITLLIDNLLKDFAYNGRQIRFRASIISKTCAIKSIKIEGKNQNDEVRIWSQEYSEPYPLIIETRNWWWKDLINIEFKILDNQKEISGYCQALVTKKGYIWTDILYDFSSDKCHVK
jgi:hypothetical protein